jgi:CsoR family transcriptional regulator, copper-sensing transcriptional repressor
MHHNQEQRVDKQKASLSVKKSLGTVNKILQMIEQDKYCPEIIQQIDAAIGLLQSSKKTLLLGHLDHCLEDKLKEDRTKAINELVKIFDLK